MKTCISWTKVSTNVICHDHEEVLLFEIYDFQMTWCVLYSHKMFRYFEDKIDNHCHYKRRQAFSKIRLWRHKLLTRLNRKLTWTPSFCSHKNLSPSFTSLLLLLLLLPRDCPVTKTHFPSSHNLQTSHIVRSVLVDETCVVTSWWGHQISNYTKSKYNIKKNHISWTTRR